LREAAMLDGASPWQVDRYIVIPIIKPIIRVSVIFAVTGSLKTYDLVRILTEGGPFNSSVMAAMHVYRTAFTEHAYGTGQAEALILFIVCAIVGITQVYIGRKGEVAA
ncbi:MAG: sugar ABC transporter permease, partial [Lachnospiraceae bacterium]|nr:sugar ABC transporter permease [Lachnospiraceae bacterium]